jgi:protein-L-isoaspartate(D-aspartate) O-methyltransferase
MTYLKNNSNYSVRKRGFSQLLVLGSITIGVILLGVASLYFLPGSSSNIDSGASAQGKTISKDNGQYISLTNVASTSPMVDSAKHLSRVPINNESDYLKWMTANLPETKDYLTAKWARSQAIISNHDASDPRVIAAFLLAPREDFFQASGPSQAYAKPAVPIGYGQTISGPHLVSRMTQAIDPKPDQKVLEIGTGSGYQSSVLAELSNHVYTIEIVPELAQKADEAYKKLSKYYPEYGNIKRKNADGYYGWAEYAPFDRIIVTTGIDHIPPDLLKQLAPGGIMVIPVGPPSGQTVLKITKKVLADGSVTFTREDIYNGKKVIFVPFTAGNGAIHSTASDNVQAQ